LFFVVLNFAYLHACDKQPLQASFAPFIENGTVDMDSLEQQLQDLEPLLIRLREANRPEEKLAILKDWPRAEEYLSKRADLRKYLEKAPLLEEIAIRSVIAIGQGDLVLASADNVNGLLPTLTAVERFYASYGGLVGYHVLMLRKMVDRKNGADETNGASYLQPEGLDISRMDSSLADYLYQGIVGMEQLGEIYPIGGAGDRLDLKDEKNGAPLPAAKLLFLGRTLLEGLIRDLQAREYLYYRLFGKQLVTPVALMTSQEKQNRDYIIKICEENNWFSRSRSSYLLFDQPLIPMINLEGDWCVSAPGQLLTKPGGHGVMWRLARDAGVFEWMKEHGRHKVLIRQINNPIAGVDHGLLMLVGVGIAQQKAFGFASCPRTVNAAEGMDLVVEEKRDDGYRYTLTNVEYTDFASRNIEDVPVTRGGLYSAFPANTNILFADIDTVDALSQSYPVPGLLVNMKSAVTCLDREGRCRPIPAARLESTMQNIADYIQITVPEKLRAGQQKVLPSFLTFNDRRKTISVTKRSLQEGQSFLDTPESCYYDYLVNAYDLLSNVCRIEMPALPGQMEYMKNGPSFLVIMHPALGPLYQVIAQKVSGGRLGFGAELCLEIAEVSLQDIQVEGSLIIHATNPLGSVDAEGVVQYGVRCGKCRLVNVKVINRGVDRTADNCYWKQEIKRDESLQIVLRGNAEFIAEDITIRGNLTIDVPDGVRITAVERDGKIVLLSEPIGESEWLWDYRWSDGEGVLLQKF
jgi:hypothetical protein